MTMTLDELFQKRVVIPKIQRDYAQGRADDESKQIRAAFLKDIRDALNKDEKTNLTFIYGSDGIFEGKEAFFPLDGQQRLTTLWLVWWFLSFKSTKLKSKKRNLENLTYSTRDSSKRFCVVLCEKMGELDAEEVNSIVNIADYITNQEWFHTKWLLDPTVSSMLRTISGDNYDRGNDSIEGVFSHRDDYENLLKTFSKKIAFECFHIKSDELPISDDLYIKINARGKPLTNFENLKAGLEKWIKASEVYDRNKTEEFAKKCDGNWTNLFWTTAKETNKAENFDGEMDSLIFIFINRFFLNKLIINEDKIVALTKADKEKYQYNYQEIFDRLYGTDLERKGTPNDTLIKYDGFDIYSTILDVDCKIIDELSNALDLICDEDISKQIKIELNSNVCGTNNVTLEEGYDVDETDEDESVEEEIEIIESEIAFIPRFYQIRKRGKKTQEYSEKKTTQTERAYFFAVCEFLKGKSANTIKADSYKEFKRWMRIARNLIENAEIQTIDGMVSCIRLINELDISSSNDVYKLLAGKEQKSEVGKTSRLLLQYNEEIEKVTQIDLDEEWEKLIIDAEQFGFFGGTIGFLYRRRDDTCELGRTCEWNKVKFENRLNNAKGLFPETENGTVPLNTVKMFLKLFRSFSDIEGLYLFTNLGYDLKKSCWKKSILTNKDLLKQVQMLLDGNEISADDRQLDFNDFLNSDKTEQLYYSKRGYTYRLVVPEAPSPKYFHQNHGDGKYDILV